MRKFLYVILFLLAIIFLRRLEHNKAEPSLVVGLCADYPPFEYKINDEFRGFDVDLAEHLGKELGKKVIFKDLDFNALIPALNAGHVDLIISSMSANPERTKQVDFSQAYFHTKSAILSIKDIDLAKLDSLKFGVQLGSTLEAYAKSKSYEYLSLANYQSLLQELKLGRIDAILIGQAQARTFLSEEKTFKFYPLADDLEPLAIALKQDSPYLITVNQALNELAKSGVLDALEKKWLEAL